MSNSSNGNSSGSNESDSEFQTRGNSSAGFGTEIGGGSGNPSSTKSNQNEGEANANLNPSKSLAHYAKGTFDPKKPLLLYASLVDALSNNQKGKKVVVDHVIGYAMFVAILGLGVIVGLDNTF